MLLEWLSEGVTRIRQTIKNGFTRQSTSAEECAAKVWEQAHGVVSELGF